ncbi:hypothetical protein V7O37_13010 [Escherichia coli]|uniref:hypothetical protein n=1 Tax=Escherichia coli TaxID=562 RepID=UPI00296A27F9|nr:hypothetical protein [Escherichia coli]
MFGFVLLPAGIFFLLHVGNVDGVKNTTDEKKSVPKNNMKARMAFSTMTFNNMISFPVDGV